MIEKKSKLRLKLRSEKHSMWRMIHHIEFKIELLDKNWEEAFKEIQDKNLELLFKSLDKPRNIKTQFLDFS